VKRAVFLVFLLFSISRALAGSVPSLPALYWGEVNAGCNLVALAPGIVIRAEYNGVLDSLPLLDEGNNVFRFGGPAASDDKLLVSGLAEGAEFNLTLYYSSRVGAFLLGTEDFNAGEVKHIHFELNSSQCSSLFPPATYHITVTLPSDCSGSLSDTTFYVYYGSTKLKSQQLDGDKEDSVDITVDGYSNSIPEGKSITFKVCKGDGCDSESTSYNYGEEANISFSVSCSSLFSSSTEETSQEAAASTDTDTTAEQTAASQTTTTSEEETEEKTTAVKTTTSGPPEVSVPPDEQNKSLVEDVVDKVSRESRRILGMPPDVAIIVAILIVMVIVAALRFIL